MEKPGIKHCDPLFTSQVVLLKYIYFFLFIDFAEWKTCFFPGVLTEFFSLLILNPVSNQTGQLTPSKSPASKTYERAYKHKTEK